MSKLSKLLVLAVFAWVCWCPRPPTPRSPRCSAPSPARPRPGATAGQRWCGNSAGTTVPVWDGTPIDVSVAFPAAIGSDNNYPVVGIYHGWGGIKITPSSAAAQRWLNQGYAVFCISDRGWGSSCGTPSKPANTVKSAPANTATST